MIDDDSNPYAPASAVEDTTPRKNWTSTWSFQFLVCVLFMVLLIAANSALSHRDWFWAYLWISLALSCIPLVDAGHNFLHRATISCILPFGVAGAFLACVLLTHQPDFSVPKQFGWSDIFIALASVACGIAVGLGIGFFVVRKLGRLFWATQD